MPVNRNQAALLAAVRLALRTADVKFDAVTNGQVTIPTEHHEVHEGDAYNISHLYSAVAKDAVVAVQLDTQGTHDIHLKRLEAYITGAKGLLELVEAPTVTDGTTPVAIINQNRAGTPRASNARAYSDPSGISGGTVLESRLFGGGGVGQQAPAGNRPIEVEFILRRNTTYLLRLTNQSAGAEDLSIWSFWYEETTSAAVED